MAKWGEINCPRCAELEAKLAQQDDLVQAAVAAERERCINLAATWSKDAAATIREGGE